MTLESSKNLGGIGAILIIISAIAFLAYPLLSVLCIVGAVLLLVALHGLAQHYNEKRIFNNGLYAFIALIVGAIVTFASVVYLVLYTTYLSDLISFMYPGFNGDWSNLPNLTPNTNVELSELLAFATPIFAVLAATWIAAIVASFFAWRSFSKLANKSAVSLFSTAGVVMLVGALLAIVAGLGLILMWIATLLMAIAFFQIKPPIESPPPMPPTQLSA